MLHVISMIIIVRNVDSDIKYEMMMCLTDRKMY